MDRPRLIFADREDGATDHGLERVLRNLHALFRLDVRQLRVVLGRHGRNGKRRNAAADFHLEIFVDRDAHILAGQLADDVKEQPRGHDALARLLNLGRHAYRDARLEIIPGKYQLDTCAHIDALERGDGALLRDRARGDGDGRNEQIFFTANFHTKCLRFFFPEKERINVVVYSSRGILCGKAVFALALQGFFLHTRLCIPAHVFNTGFCETAVSRVCTSCFSTFHIRLWKTVRAWN